MTNSNAFDGTGYVEETDFPTTLFFIASDSLPNYLSLFYHADFEEWSNYWGE